MQITTETGSVYEITGKTLRKVAGYGPFTRVFQGTIPEVPAVGQPLLIIYANGQTLRTSTITSVRE